LYQKVLAVALYSTSVFKKNFINKTSVLVFYSSNRT